MKGILVTTAFLLVLVCKASTTCQDGKNCQNQKGTCLVMGDPHYRTFDGNYYNFMGNCTYILAKNCRDDDKHPQFEIYTKNERNKDTQKTLVSAVTVIVYGNTITFHRYEYGVAIINDLSWNFPIFLNNGRVKLNANSLYATVETDFGLTVLYDWDQYLVVTVSNSFMGRMCGMCGNFNGNKNDDLTNPSGCKADSIPELGKSWRVPHVPGDTFCRDECPGRCRGCQDASWFTRMNAKVSCSAVTFLTKGAFAKCSSVIDPRVFYDICKYDYCSGKEVIRFLCNTAEIYTVACKLAGIHVYEWRKLLKCPHPACPKNSHFEACACPATCENRTPSADCKANCIEGCVCDEGYLWSGNKCVPKTQCGCMYKNGGDERYLQAGESIWADDTCRRSCTCNPTNGQVVCVNADCPAGTECKRIKGEIGCYLEPYATCSIRGDPHYKTFDNVTYDFMGTCTYTAAQGCDLEGTGLTPFTVVVENEGWNENQRNPSVSMAKVVVVEVYDFIIVLRRNQLHQVMVNGILTNIPVNLNEGQVRVQQEGFQIVIITDFGLRVAYNMVYDVFISVPNSYHGKTCGLCGNNNGQRNDEFLLPNGKETKEIHAFGAAWKLAVPGVVCADGCSGDFCPKCPEDKKRAFEKDCSVITNPRGPFAACHNVINPESYFRDCVFDVCMGEGDAHMLCHSIAAYMTDCHGFGVNVGNWRTPTLCPFTCPSNSKYEVCAKTCSTPCPGLDKIIKCQRQTCHEGCMCDPGFFTNGTSCVKADQCGCHVNGRTYKINEVVIADNCQQRLTCHPSGEVKYEEMSCKSDEVCQVKDGIRGCYQKQCSLEAEGSFTLFSGHRWILSSVGFYELVKVCNDALVAEWFRVVVELKSFGRFSSAVSLHVFFEETFISIKSTKATWINGRLVRLPYRIKEITIQESEDVIVIGHTSGFRVSYSLSKGVIATVGKTMADKVCGICGIDSEIAVIEEYLHNYKALDFTCLDL